MNTLKIIAMCMWFAPFESKLIPLYKSSLIKRLCFENIRGGKYMTLPKQKGADFVLQQKKRTATHNYETNTKLSNRLMVAFVFWSMTLRTFSALEVVDQFESAIYRVAMGLPLVSLLIADTIGGFLSLLTPVRSRGALKLIVAGNVARELSELMYYSIFLFRSMSPASFAPTPYHPPSFIYSNIFHNIFWSYLSLRFFMRLLLAMGIVFGVTGTQEPAFQLLRSMGGYEVRSYPQYFIAQVKMNQAEENDAFRTLAKYIGVFGDPEIVVGEGTSYKPMAMTSPVISSPSSAQQLAMTAPVITSEDKLDMAFVLPFSYKAIKDIPRPLNPRIVLKDVPPKVVAVKKFSGWYSPIVGSQKRRELLEEMQQDGILDNTDHSKSLEWSVAQYHPPFTIPFLRRNEVWITLPAEIARKFELAVDRDMPKSNSQDS